LTVPGKKSRVGKPRSKSKSKAKKGKEAPPRLDPNAEYAPATGEAIAKMAAGRRGLQTMKKRYTGLSYTFGESLYPMSAINSFSADDLKGIMQEAAERGHLVTDPRFENATAVLPVPTRPATAEDIVRASQSPNARADLQKIYKTLKKRSELHRRGYDGLYPDMRADRDISDYVKALQQAARNGHLAVGTKHTDNLMVKAADETTSAASTAKATADLETSNVIEKAERRNRRDRRCYC
jgi:hypothetical protein